VEVRRLSRSVRVSIPTYSDYHTHLLAFSLFFSAPLNLTSIIGLVWSFGLNYILPIILNAAQLAIPSYLQSGNVTMLINSAKVVINIVSTSVTTLRTKHLIDLPASNALLGKAEDLTRNMLEVVPVPPPVEVPDDAIGATVSAHSDVDGGLRAGRHYSKTT